MGANKGHRIDVTEQLTHVRTVHFALLALCFLLFVTSLLNRDTEVKRAIEQLRIINNVSAQWNEAWLQNLFKTKVLEPKDKPKVSYGPWLIEGAQDRPAIFVDHPVSEHTFWPLPTPLDEFANYHKHNLKDEMRWDWVPEFEKPKTLAEFKKFWNAINTTINLNQIKSVKNKATVLFIKELEVVENKSETASLTQPLSGKVGCNVSPNLTLIRNYENRHELRAVKSDSSYIYILHGYCPELPTYDNESWSVSIEVNVKVVDKFNGQAIFIEANKVPNSVPLGIYEQSFPDLARVTANYDDLELQKLLVVLSAETSRAGERIELFGAKLPGGNIANLGLPLLCLVQLYFLLHLNSLSESISVKPENGFISWIGMYQDKLAQVTTIVSACLFPIVTAFTLRYNADALKPWESIGLTILLIICILLSGLTCRSLNKVRLAATSISQQDRKMNVTFPF